MLKNAGFTFSLHYKDRNRFKENIPANGDMKCKV